MSKTSASAAKGYECSISGIVEAVQKRDLSVAALESGAIYPVQDFSAAFVDAFARMPDEEDYEMTNCATSFSRRDFNDVAGEVKLTQVSITHRPAEGRSSTFSVLCSVGGAGLKQLLAKSVGAMIY